MTRRYAAAGARRGRVMTRPDPIETIVNDALMLAGIPFDRDVPSPCGTRALDFWVPTFRSFIEVKRFHTARALDQMATVDNIIVAQGEQAVRSLARLILQSTVAGRAAIDAGVANA